MPAIKMYMGSKRETRVKMYKIKSKSVEKSSDHQTGKIISNKIWFSLMSNQNRNSLLLKKYFIEYNHKYNLIFSSSMDIAQNKIS